MKAILIISVLFIARVLSASESSISEMIAANPFFIEKDKVAAIVAKEGIDEHQLLHQLIPIAKKYSRPPISNYHVGVAALGKSGNIYLGVNIEFAGLPLNEAVHGEQFLVVNARSHREQELVALAVSAAPCGHCRQFLYEMGGENSMLILTPNAPPTTLAALLPEPFGPQDLGLPNTLMQQPDKEFDCEHISSLVAKALQAARASYAPYTESKSGVAIQTKDGSIYTGSYLENAAFNPSLSPLQAALVTLILGKKEYDDIEQVVLAEQMTCKISHAAVSKHMLECIAPHAVLKKIEFK